MGGQPDFDLLTYSTPCQDISTAGKQAGLIEGSDTRSSIIWYTKYAIQQKKPKYLLGENVKNLVGKNHRGEYFRWLQFLESEGYTNYYAIINAKDYGVPQHRERVFTVSILGDHDIYHFPAPIPLEIRLKDILEEEVDDKYVLSETAIQGFLKHNENHKAKGTGFLWIPKDVETEGGKLLIASRQDNSNAEQRIITSVNLGGGQSLTVSEELEHSAQRTIPLEKSDIANCLRARSSLNATDNTILEHAKRDIVMLYEIWSEGFRVSGETGSKAYKIGEQKANSFEEACDLFVKRNPQYKDCYEKRNGVPAYWGCRWFDNEADARKAFG